MERPVRQRGTAPVGVSRPQVVGDDTEIPGPTAAATTAAPESESHPAGASRHGQAIQIWRAFTFAVYLTSCGLAIHVAQCAAALFYFYRRDYYNRNMAKVKEFWSVVIITMTQQWGQTTMRVSGDADVAASMTTTRDGRISCQFPDRMVVVANHQIYTDWVYLWWLAYANLPRMDGHLYIILKESLKYLPIIGPGMMMFGFIFMSRKMAIDQPRMAYRLGKLKEMYRNAQGKQVRYPMWLLLFPEGTNANPIGREKSAAWAKKTGIPDLDHLLLPRSTGLRFCLQELKGTIDYMYDCTVAYEGVPRGRYASEFFTLSGTYFQGRPPKSVSMYWRRFKLDDMPLDDAQAFDEWIRQRWTEKDHLMEEYFQTGQFPSIDRPHLVTEVRTAYPYEVFQVFSVIVPLGIAVCAVLLSWHMFS